MLISAGHTVAGIMDYPWTPAGEVTPDLIRRLYATNVVGLVRTMHAFLPLLAQSRQSGPPPI